LFSAWRDCIASYKDDTLMRILCIAGSQVFSNAVTERNFSSVTRLLSPQQTRTGSNLLSAQLLACRAKKWAQVTKVKKLIVGQKED
jgi:hypothetical protein